MVLDAFKKYPSQISSAFRRFPIASAFAILTFIALIFNSEYIDLLDSNLFSPENTEGFLFHFYVWFCFYPPAALLVSLATSLVQESLKNRKWQPQVITGGSLFVLSVFLFFFFTRSFTWANYYFIETIIFVYLIAALSIFIAPFWKQKDENAFWIFLFRNLKALIVGAVVASLLLGSVEALVFAFGQLFEYEFDEKIFLYIFFFCASIVFPILYFTGIPSIEECHSETPALSKFATSTIRFLFFPVLSLAILLFYAYIVKFIVQWDMPQGMVSYFVSGFMIYMLALVTIMYPTRLGSGQSFEKKLLKIFPVACIPLVVMMSVGLVRRISDYGISEMRIYVAAINIFFYAVIAILLIDKIKCKSKYIAIVFCAIFFIFTETPFNAQRITHHVWMENIKSALTEQGYTEYPLNREDSKQFVWNLRNNGDKESMLLVSRISELTRVPDKELAEYINITRFDDAFINSLGSKKCCGENEDEDEGSEPFDAFNISVEYPEKMAFDIPHGARAAVTVEHHFSDNEFEFRGDTLTFRISLEKDDCGCEEDSACADSTAESTAAGATSDIYSFTVDRRTLKQDKTKFIKTDRATLAISNRHAAEWSKTRKDLSITGILFIE